MHNSSSPRPEPLVSVGIPVYNGAEQLPAAVESALNQDYANLEVIVCDNASEDETESIGRGFAAADDRVRYMRNATNIGFLPNFKRVLDESRGTYFTWLAHDDVLSDTSYIRAVVGYLESHPDVVACNTALYLLDNELPGSVELMEFPEIRPERWPHARGALFRWPHGWLDSVIYGVFRRDDLAKIRIPLRSYKGRPNIFCWEMDVLTALSGRGAIVALPQPMRSYRLSTQSVGFEISARVSSYNLLVLGLRMKAVLLARAFRLPVPWRERLVIIATAIGNLFRANFRQPYDLRVVLQEREKEFSMLKATARERAQLIDSLRSEIEARRGIARARGFEGARDELAPIGSPDRPPVDPQRIGRVSRNRLSDFLFPLSDAQVQHMNELNECIGRLRRFCAEQLSAIQALQDRADEWLRLIEA